MATDYLAIIKYNTTDIFNEETIISIAVKADLATHHLIVDGLKKETPQVPITSKKGGIAEYSERKELNR